MPTTRIKLTRIIRIGLRTYQPSLDLWIQQANASDHSECDRNAYQHCSCPTARVKLKIPTTRIKFTRIIQT
eukprot:2832131-Pyramimonas_sp.AAC.1